MMKKEARADRKIHKITLGGKMKPLPRQNPPVGNVTNQLVPPSASGPINSMADEPVSLPLPSLEYLLSCSKESLQDVELTNLNRAANCV
jgi:hypothetical protein